MVRFLCLNTALMALLSVFHSSCTSYGQPDQHTTDTLRLPVLTL